MGRGWTILTATISVAGRRTILTAAAPVTRGRVILAATGAVAGRRVILTVATPARS